MSSSGRILKISSFCSPKKRYQTRYESQKQVSISLLQSKVQRLNGEEYDDYSTVFTDDNGLLISLQVFEGALCRLSNICSCCPSERRSSVIVHLRMLPETNTHSMKSIQSDVPVLFVPILTPVSIGVCESIGDELKHTVIIEKLNEDECHHYHATSIKVMEICNPPIDFAPSFQYIFAQQNSSLIQSLDKEKDALKNSSLQRYFIQPENKNGRLLTEGSIIATVDDPSVSARFYKIISLSVRDDTTKSYAWVTPKVDIILLPSSYESVYSIPRFPSRDFVKSFMTGSQVIISPDARSPHSELTRALLRIGTMKIPLDSSTLPNMIHVIRDGDTVEVNSLLDFTAERGMSFFISSKI